MYTIPNHYPPQHFALCEHHKQTRKQISETDMYVYNTSRFQAAGRVYYQQPP